MSRLRLAVGSEGDVVVAVGVETAEERDTLMDLGIDVFQGYHIAKPQEPFRVSTGSQGSATIERHSVSSQFDEPDVLHGGHGVPHH